MEKLTTMARYRRVRPNLKNKLTKFWKAATRVPPPPPTATPPTVTVASTTTTEGVDSTTVTPKKGFLDLPGELRNRIYRMELLQDKSIKVSKRNFTEPPLLMVCHKIRAETISIFYLENRWSLDCPDWDCSARHGFYNHVRTRPGIDDITDLNASWTNSGSYYHKKNLLNFAKALHDDQIQRGILYVSDHENVETAAVTGAFEIVKRMSKQSWEDIEQVLDVYLHEVAKENDGWKWR
jgi:hypothetical protein